MYEYHKCINMSNIPQLNKDFIVDFKDSTEKTGW